MFVKWKDYGKGVTCIPPDIPYRCEKDNIVKNKHLTDVRMLEKIWNQIPQGICVVHTNGPTNELLWVSK